VNILNTYLDHKSAEGDRIRSAVDAV